MVYTKDVLYFVVLLLLLLWIFGYVSLPFIVIPDIDLFSINGRVIDLPDLLLFIVGIWAIGILPSPLRQIAGAVIVLWTLSTLGFIAIAGLSQLLMLALIIGVLVALFQK